MTIYVVDDGYAGSDPTIQGDRVEGKTHGTMMCDIARIFNPKAEIVSVQIPGNGVLMEIIQRLAQLNNIITEDDVVLFGWITRHDLTLTLIVSRMANKSTVVVPAGNYGDSVLNYSPTTVRHAHVVASINHHGNRMSKSNYGDDLKEMYGVPIHHLNITDRGTSVAAAIYAGLISRNKSEKFMRRARKVLHNMFHRGEAE